MLFLLVPRISVAQDPGEGPAAIGAMRAAAGAPLRVTTSPRTGLATFIGGPGGVSIPVPDPAARTPNDRALAFVEAYGRAFGLRGRSDVAVSRIEKDALGFDHVRMRQVVSGVPVTGGEMIVHLRGDRVLSVNGRALGDLENFGVIPAVASNEAENVAREFATMRLNAPNAVLSEPRLEIFNQGLLNGRDFPTRLAWFVEVRELALREFVWIDAKSKTVLLHFSQLADAKNRSIYNGNNFSTLPGTLMRTEGGAATSDADANNAYDFAGLTYDYYFDNHGRDSFNNAGGALITTVHHCPASNPCPPDYANAFWNGAQMVYGTGFASADDVVAHELTHAVTEHSANLFYYMQSGALNESFSDIFGETVDLGNGAGTDLPNVPFSSAVPNGVRWLLGEDLSIHAIRDMWDPTHFGDPGKMSDPQFKCEISPAAQDAGGVHTNSGVPNHAYALMVDGDTYNGITVASIGVDKAAKIQYRALTQYLTSASDFLDNYNALQQACADLVGTIGITSGNCAEVKKALDAVQMSNVWPCAPAQATPPALCSAGLTPVNLFFDNFESGLGNWTISGTSGVWSRAGDPTNIFGGTAYATSGVDSLWGFDPDFVADARVTLSSNLPTIPSGARLQFNHSYGFDMGASTNYDGGVLEVSTDGGANWFDASSLFAVTGAVYGGNIATGFLNPLAGRNAFVRQSYGYTASQFFLGGLQGLSAVRFRFRIGADNSPGFLDYGWFIDDFRVYTCVAPTVTSGAANAIASTGATLNGTVNPNGVATSGSFDYGLTSSYGSTTPPQNLGSGTSAVSLSAGITGLSSCTTYHFRATAATTAGVTNGVDSTFTTAGCPVSPPVQWTNAVGVGVSGNSLVKSSGTPGWNAGAISVQTLSGDGQVDFIATETTTYRMVGLGNGDTNQDYPDIQYAIWLGSSGTSAVYESGVFKFGYAPYAGGDKFTVGVESGVVKYRRNGVLFYTSLIAPAYPLVVDTSLYDPGATVTNARILGFVEPPPTLSINDVSITERNAGTTNATFTVSLAGTTASTVTVDYATANGSAASPSDYAAATGALTFAPGDTTKAIVVTVNGDATPETNETFFVNLSNPTNAVIGDTQGVGMIVNDDLAPPVQWTNVVGIGVSGNSLVKSSGTPGWNAGAVSVQTLSGDGQVDFIATETTTYRMVGLGNGDTNQDYPDIQYAIWLSSSGTSAVYESGVFKFGYAPYAGGDKFTVGVESGVVKYRRNGVLFYTSLIAPTYPLVIDTSLYDPGATVTNARILGFVEPPPTLSINDVSIAEGNAGTTNATFTVSLAGITASTVTVDYATANGSAASPSDYAATTGTLTFAPGDTTKTIVVAVNGDTTVETNETFFVNLSNATNAVIGDTQGVGTILNDDLAPPVQWTNVVGVGVSGNSLVKSSGTPGWNAGAISVQTLSGDGQVDFIATETTTYRMVGLGNGDSNQDYPDIQYAIWLSSSGTSAVYESGVFKFGHVPYAGGDKFTVGVESGVVKYRRNGVLFYTSLIAPTYPLVVDTSLYDPGATVTNARVVGFVGPSIP